jgi:hypothetical protein
MEVMKRDHECGVLLWALSSSSTSEPLVNETSETEVLEQEEDVVVEVEDIAPEPPITPPPSLSVLTRSIPDIQLTRATLFEASPPQEDPEVIEVLASPMTGPISDSDPNGNTIAASPTELDYRLSTISLSLSPSSLSFPIPPSREPFMFHDEVKENDVLSSQGHDLEDAETDYDSSFGHGPDQQPIGSSLFPSQSQILIYPPSHLPTLLLGHGGGLSPDMPHTPYRSDHEHGQEHGEEQESRWKLNQSTRGTGLSPVPLRTRRSKPELRIPIPDRPAPKSLVVGIGAEMITRDKTSPLRVGNKAKSRIKTKTQSMPFPHAVTVDGQKRFKKGRESRLENVSLVCSRSLSLTM